jgi:16S rRNA (uracil1498-N3)-methyltransferase
VNLIILEPHEVSDAGVATLSGARAAHIATVLKTAVGRSIRVGVLDGPFGTGAVTSVGDGAVTLQCAFEHEAPPRPPVDLLLALPRPKVMNRLWAQLAALGVGQIILTSAERVERPYFDTHVLATEHYRPRLIEGLQQARDTRLPAVSIHRQFRKLVEDELSALFPVGRRLVADPGADPGPESPGPEGPGLHLSKPTNRLLLAIGPEGGWNAFELGLLKAHGFEAVGMGPRTLRSDTACIALLTLAHAALRT